MTRILNFPLSETLTVDLALKSAITASELLSTVLIVGYYKDGRMFVRSSRMDRKDALWLSEQLRDYAKHS